MKNVFLSALDFNDPQGFKSKTYVDCVRDLVKLPDILSLDNFHQHLNTSRLQHSFNVSYYSYLLCMKLGWDYRAAARAGLMHDLFLYDWRAQKRPEGNHAKAHPIVALKNAKNLTDLSLIEEDAIIKHMWPLTSALPKYKESYAVTLADKYCALLEVVFHFAKKAKSGALKFRRLVSGMAYAR